MSSDAVKGINWRCNTMPRRLCESSQTPRRILEAGSLREAIYSKQYSFGGFNQVSAVACCRVLPQGGAVSSEFDFMLNFRAGEARGAAEIVGHGLLTGRGDVTPVDAN